MRNPIARRIECGKPNPSGEEGRRHLCPNAIRRADWTALAGAILNLDAAVMKR